ncbi:MAG: hypothetical protein LBO72_01745 [Helicobacteraceae bacterium]|jgi:YD repeat-containing protein|nr:hypothetical protein [Helicobacteraceae bacterium]
MSKLPHNLIIKHLAVRVHRYAHDQDGFLKSKTTIDPQTNNQAVTSYQYEAFGRTAITNASREYQ